MIVHSCTCVMLLLCVCVAPVASAQARTPADPSEAATLSRGRLRVDAATGPNVWEQGPFRINFLRTGKDAVPLRDIDGNGCPDVVENIARQLVTAHHAYVALSGFPDPFASPRYKGLEYILVFVRDRQHKILNGANGRAYDELRKGRLTLAVARHVDPIRNLTPAHEYFHCIQSGATYFKNTWYFEGLARWAEDVAAATPPVRGNADELRGLLTDPARTSALFRLSYKAAELLWRPLAALSDEENAPDLPADDPLLALRYTDGTPVMQDFSFAGAARMARLLRELDKADDAAFAAEDYETWSEARQRDPRNNRHILEAVMRCTEPLEQCRIENVGLLRESRERLPAPEPGEKPRFFRRGERRH